MKLTLLLFKAYLNFHLGRTRYLIWLRHWATSQHVKGLITDSIIGTPLWPGRLTLQQKWVSGVYHRN